MASCFTESTKDAPQIFNDTLPQDYTITTTTQVIPNHKVKMTKLTDELYTANGAVYLIYDTFDGVGYLELDAYAVYLLLQNK